MRDNGGGEMRSRNELRNSHVISFISNAKILDTIILFILILNLRIMKFDN